MKKSLAITCVIWVLATDLATAGDYTLILGKGVEVCEAFLKNLNSFPNDPPMVCERKVNPKFPAFSKPIWQPLDATKHLDLIEQIERWKPYETGFEDPNRREEILARIKERIANGDIRLATTELDIEQDGVSETVLKYEYADCDPMSESHFAFRPGRAFYVLGVSKMQIDREKSMSVNIFDRADIFLFKGRVYLTHWGGDLGFVNGTLSVYHPLSVVGQPGRCDYRYKASKARRQS